MAIGSGLGASFGLAPESVYGTYVAPTRFHDGTFNIDKQFAFVKRSGVAAGRVAAVDEIVSTSAGTGQLACDFIYSGMGLLLQNMFGANATVVQQGGTAAYLQTHTLADNAGKSLTAQVGIPDTGGTVRPYTGKGGKVNSLEFSCAVNEILKLTAELDFKAVSEAESLSAPSYNYNNLPFHGGQMAVKLGTFGSEASVSGVRAASLKIERPMDLDEYYAGSGGTKAQPIWNDFAMVTGTVETDYITKADFVDRFVGHTSTSMVLEWVSTVAIASTFYPTIRFKLPKVYMHGQVPPVGGPDVMKASVPFEAFLDTTNGLIVGEYMSTDTAV